MPDSPYTTLISPDALESNLKNVRLFDCRFSLMDAAVGLKEYAAGHIEGAVYVHLNDQLSAPVTNDSGRHPLPTREEFVAQVERWGVKPGDQLVAYDGDTGAYAARFWWMMRWLGHTNVAVLDGGFAHWQSKAYETTTEVPHFPPSTYPIGPALTRQVDVADLPDANACVIDARDSARFRGEVEPIDPVAGHIPGAVCHPFTSNLKDGTFRSAADLDTEFRSLTQSGPVVCYCGSGVTAAHNILAMVHAGLPEPALYPGSWSQWVSDPNRPIATGE